MEKTESDQDQSHDISQNSQLSQQNGEGLSKRALKRLQKKQDWEVKKEQLKITKKAERSNKKTKTSQSHITRFNRDEEGKPQKFSKQEKQQMFGDLSKKGPKVIIDCDFEKLMLDREIKSMCQQLGYCTNANKQVVQPCNLIMSGVKGQIKEKLVKQDYQNWAITSHEDTYLNYYDKKDLVYLTADSENQPAELDPSKIYIIGGIVDRNRYKNLTLNKAKEDGISHARLPIGDLMALRSSSVLAVNHVFQIVAEWFNTKDWKHALDKVVPERKQDKNAVVKVKDLLKQKDYIIEESQNNEVSKDQ